MDPNSKSKAEIVDQTALARLDPQALILVAIEKGAGIEALERLVALATEVRAQQAREAWHRAMAEFQRTCPPIRKTETARIGSSYSYRYAPLDEIIPTILPVMGLLGLSVSYRQIETGAERVTVSCIIAHEQGHREESGPVSMPVMSEKTSGANASQRVGVANTYAKRYALLAIIGLAPEDDPDAEPEPLQPPRAKSAPVPVPAPPSTGNTSTGPTAEELAKLYRLASESGVDSGYIAQYMQAQYNVASSRDLDADQFRKLCDYLIMLTALPSDSRGLKCGNTEKHDVSV